LSPCANRKKSEGLTGDEKVQAEKELAELEKKHERQGPLGNRGSVSSTIASGGAMS